MSQPECIPKRRYRPSSSAWQWGNLTLTQYNSGCIRSIVLEQLTGLKPDFPPVYAALGAHHEVLIEAELNNDIAEREYVIKSDLLDNVIYSARADFILKSGKIIEAKASLGKTLKYKREPIPKASHISQVVSYMLQLNQQEAAIAWGHYKAVTTSDGAFIFTHQGTTTYEVRIATSGQVLIDGEAIPYFAQDQLAHMYATAAALQSEDWQSISRPLNWDSKWASPCNRCPFQATCDKFDNRYEPKEKST